MTGAAFGLAAAAALASTGIGGWAGLRARGLDRCFGDYLRDAHRRRPSRPGEPVHVLLCIADHFEPKWAGATPEVADRRVRDWAEDYPRVLGGFRDRDGRPPRHTFFYPIDEYEPDHVEAIAGLCRAGFGEVEVHLHHDGDTSEGLRETLEAHKEVLGARHGLLSTRPDGAVAFGFVHGNWALDNSRPDGRCCGVNDELDVLRRAGCYADFTMPSAPDRCQTRTTNRVYYAVDDPRRPRSHDRGVEVGSAPRPEGALMMIQGPLLLDWSDARWGVIPRLENGCLQANQAPTMVRLDRWVRAGVRVAWRPDWSFVKLHTHGAQEATREVLLGEPGARFHASLADRMAADPDFHVHYVTAREMYNLARAAESGYDGPVDGARDFELTSRIVLNRPAPLPPETPR